MMKSMHKSATVCFGMPIDCAYCAASVALHA
jgi:hypothetical protein